MSSRTRNSRRRDKTHVSGFVVIALLFTIIAAGFALVLSGFKLVDSWLQDLPDYTNADAYLSAEPTEILDADGNVIASLYLQNRKSVQKDQVSEWVFKATVDTEDERFYSHNGIDPKGIARAAFKSVSGGNREGASTITQQLVRNTILSDEQFEVSLRRKVREAYIALQIEKIYSKDQILMMYLNTIYYGSGAYGIEAASQTYLGKKAQDLTLSEAALLSGLPQSPSKLDPTKNPEAAKERRNTVLKRMLTNGDITQEQYDEASSEDIKLNYTPPTENGTYKYPYFVDYVKSLLLQKFPKDTLFKSGLTVKTTIRPKLQEAATDAVLSKVEGGGDRLEAALVSIDPKTGYIVAMVGGRNYEKDQFNLATQSRRQPGSSFKTFTLVTAIAAGMDPQTKVNGDSPCTIGDWKVSNFGGKSMGILTLETATWKSSNTAYARLANALGAGSIVDTAHKMGITSKLEQFTSITLGTSGVSPLEMASGYATLAAGGVHREPVAITEIVDRNGDTIYKAEDKPEQVIDPKVAGAVTNVLKGVLTSGTGRAAALSNGQEAAGKTGTTQKTRDLWFVGYTPQFSTAVWTGYRQEAEIKYGGSVASTGKIPSPIWKSYMEAALQTVPKESFPTVEPPTYNHNANWGDLGVSQSSTDEVQIDPAGQAKINELRNQYPGFKVQYTYVHDVLANPGQVLGTSVDTVNQVINVRVATHASDEQSGSITDEPRNGSDTHRGGSSFDNVFNPHSVFDYSDESGSDTFYSPYN